MRRLLLLTVLACAARAALAAPPVLTGDPIDAATGQAWRLLPGAALMYPGDDDKWGTGDETIDGALVGDVDLVVRTGGTFLGGMIPPPSAGVGGAPAVTVGGTATGLGAEFTAQAILSDGLPPFAWGNALLGSDLDARGVLFTSFADLDGDGVVGPNAGDGTGDDALERQESLQLVARQLAVLSGGVAQTTMAVQIGLPASEGGLAVVVGAGASTGATPQLYDDGPWIATLLPFVPPLDQLRMIGGPNAPPPAADSLVDLEIEPERIFVPPSTDPVVGGALTIPVDGSSPTVDLLRALSGPASAASFARPLVAAGFAADPLAVARPLVDATGARRVVALVDRAVRPDDATGRPDTVLVFPSDLLGNQADPPAGGLGVTLEAGPHLRITAPDGDGDPRRETLAFTGARAVAVTIDGTGTGAVTNLTEHVFALRAGVPIGVLRVDLGQGGGPGGGGGFDTAKAKINNSRKPAADAIALVARFTADPAAIQPDTQSVDLAVAAPGGTLYARMLPVGTLRRNASGTTFGFKDAKTVAGPRIANMRIKRTGSSHELRLKVAKLDLTGITPPPATVSASITIGGVPFAADLPCTTRGSSTICVR